MITKRGKRVRALVIAVLAIAILVLVDNATTPDNCKGKRASEMSEGCLAVLYPN